ncbi:transposase, Mutator family protein [Erwinia tracheiphila PSU-1]|nr:transposase, Mutator family protein [Erwinia tracheiphila PSU-1]
MFLAPGMWLAENESVEFWLNVLAELKNRGLNDILISCVDGLKGFPDAINEVYPQARIPLCIVHMVRNSLCNREEIMSERGIMVDHSPFTGGSSAWCRWKYLYRAVDTDGQTIDFLLTVKRYAATGLRFFRKAIHHQGEPDVMTIDKSGANIVALNAGKSEE